MNNKIFAYEIAELEKKKVLSESKDIYNNNVINEEQYSHIVEEYESKLYTPSIFMRITLFISFFLGISFAIGFFSMFMLSGMESVVYIFLFLVGFLIIFITEKVVIKEKLHFKSGATEAGIYYGIGLIVGSLSPILFDSVLLSLTLGLLISVIILIRYLDILGLLSSIFFVISIVFYSITEIGGIVEVLMPFIFMTLFSVIYWLTSKLQKRFTSIVFDNLFVILKSITLIVIYISTNYFVVRELSIELMGLRLSEFEDIPFAILFYGLTILIPLAYLLFGIKLKSYLILRVGILTSIITLVTFQHYFFYDYTMLSVLISGAILIFLTLALFKYLKSSKNGFTSEKLFQDKMKIESIPLDDFGG